MPSIRALSTVALVLAASPTDSFVIPTSGNARAEHAVPSRGGTSFSGRLQRASSAAASAGARPRRTRGGACGAIMMAKKKATGKKKAFSKSNSTTGDTQAGRNKVPDGGVTASTRSRGGDVDTSSGVAVADAPGSSSAPPTSTTAAFPAVASEAIVDGNDGEAAILENRVADAEPVDVQAGASSVGSSPEGAKDAGGKGFGAPAAKPKPAPRKTSSGMAADGGVRAAPRMEAGESETADTRSLPRIIAPGSNPNPMSSSSVPMDPSHRRTLPEGSGQVTDASFEFDEDMAGLAKETEAMTPIEMLRYMRENNIAVDLETMKAVQLPTGEEAKLAAMFPYPSEEMMARLSLGPQPKPSEYVSAMMPLMPEDEPWNPKKVRPMAALKDFLVANRLHGGSRAMNVISSLMLKAMGKGDLERAKMLKGLGICVTKAEDAVTGPFRQAVMFAENRLAPRMGSLACEEYAGEDAADIAATWVVLKACVAEWELRLRQVRKEEVGLHDIFRAIPNPADGLDEERTAAITASVQAMGLSFSNNEKLIGSLPAELRFLEGALGLNTTTEVRRFALQEFCPKQAMPPEELRFRMRSLICGLQQLPRRSYHQLEVAVTDVAACLVEGTPESYNIYGDNWQTGEDLSFETYRVEPDDKRRQRLREIILDTTPGDKTKEDNPYDSLFKQVLPKSLWGAASVEAGEDKPPYVMVKQGWLDSLDYLDEDLMEYRRSKEGAARRVTPMKAPGEEGWDAEPTDDIFTDLLNEEREMLMEFDLTDDDEVIAAAGIRDGPGPGMRKLDLGFDFPEEFEEMAAELESGAEEDGDTFISRA